jgi:CSLREA domain-containing protein
LRGDGQILLQLSAPSQIFTVNSTSDPGAGICDAAECTLREAITAANSTPAADEIQFNLPGAGPHTIAPTSELPMVLHPRRNRDIQAHRSCSSTE